MHKIHPSSIGAVFQLEPSGYQTKKKIILIQTFENRGSECFVGTSIEKMKKVHATFISSNTCFIDPSYSGIKFYARQISIASITPPEPYFKKPLPLTLNLKPL